MAKRFSDTDKWKKPFIRSLEAPYKLLWFYILDDCDHAGIWHVDFDVAQIRIGLNINATGAINAFGDKIKVLDNGNKWFISDFIEFQYGTELNPKNKVHASAIEILKKNSVYEFKGLGSPLDEAKDKDKDKDMDKDMDKDIPNHVDFKSVLLSDQIFMEQLSMVNKGKNIEQAWAECYLYHSNTNNPPKELSEWKRKLTGWLSNKKVEVLDRVNYKIQ